ncbi:MAG TPA: hypothetical protein VGL83_17385 [Stellaceae bacterium]|jgi:hypothetical protein
MRDPEDENEARAALEEWLEDKPEAAIVVAAIDRNPDDTLDVALKLSRLTAYHLVGLVQALLQQALDAAEATPGAGLDPELETLRRAKALLDGEKPTLM